jgi:hypothetical protein
MDQRLNRRQFFKLGGLAILAGASSGCGRGSINRYWKGREEKVNKKRQELEKELEEDKKLIHGVVIEDEYIPSPGNSTNGQISGRYSGFISSGRISGEVSASEPSKYLLKIRTDQGKDIVVNVVDDNVPGEKESLRLLIKKGVRVSFPRGNAYLVEYDSPYREPEIRENSEQTFFYDNTIIGNKYARVIRVEKQSEK